MERLKAFLALLPLLPASAYAQSHPAVLELFTSQGCSSCPPADKLAANYADRPDVLVLSYHISYWDRLGWKDPFSSDQWTARQQEYVQKLNLRNAYTPQAVIQGKQDVVGSRPSALADAIAKAQQTPDWVNIAMKHDNGKLAITLPESTLGASLVLVGYEKSSSNAVPRGENAGKQLAHRNNVVEFRHLEMWDGHAKTRVEESPNGNGAAVLLQLNDGRIIGADWL